MRLPPFFLAWCIFWLAGFTLAKQYGFDAWPFAVGSYAAGSATGSRGGEGSGSSGGYSSGSSSHK